MGSIKRVSTKQRDEILSGKAPSLSAVQRDVLERMAEGAWIVDERPEGIKLCSKVEHFVWIGLPTFRALYRKFVIGLPPGVETQPVRYDITDAGRKAIRRE